MRHRYHAPNINKSDRVYRYMQATKDSFKGQNTQRREEGMPTKNLMVEKQLFSDGSYQ